MWTDGTGAFISEFRSCNVNSLFTVVGHYADREKEKKKHKHEARHGYKCMCCVACMRVIFD
jgi:hypothetical protein